MEFGILGPLEVRRDGQRLAVPGRHHPRLLAALLTDPGRVVTMDRLIAVLWEDEPPATARRQVQNAMAGLRRGFGAGGAAIVAVEAGYRVDLEHGEVDATRFARLVGQARVLRDGGERSAALNRLREALALWRGDAFTGVTGRFIDSAAIRLNDARVAAIEDRVELELELGGAESPVGELRGLLDRYPYRQRSAALLMTALAEAGRVPEALEVFTRMRAELAGGLGVEPDSRLVERHRELLRSQQVPTTPETEPPPVPAQLPAAARTFTGRTEHLARLDRLLDSGGTVVVSAIAGMGGAGKTALAVHWGHRVREQFPDGQLYLNLRGYGTGEPVTPTEALTRLLRTLGVLADNIPADRDAAARLFRSLLSNRRALLVLDNALDAEQLRPLLPGRFAGVVLVTSRNRMTELSELDGAEPLSVDVMSPGEAMDLLARLVGARRMDREPEAARELVRLCGRLPLALRIAAAQLGVEPDRDLADLVAELVSGSAVDQLAVEGEPEIAVTATLDASLSRLRSEAVGLFLALGLLPGDEFCEDLAVRLHGGDPTTAATVVSTLVNAHLLENHRTGYFRFHDLVKQYVRRRANTDLDAATRDRIREATVGWYAERNRSLPIEEAENVVAMGRAWPDLSQAWRLATCLLSFTVNVRGLPAYLELAERLARSFDPGARGRMASEFATAMAALYRATGHRHRAVDYSRLALEIAEQSPDGDAIGEYANSLGLGLSELGDYNECARYLRLSLDRAIAANATRQIINVSGTLADIEVRLGDLGAAEQAIRVAIAAADTLPDDARPATPNMNLGILHRNLGRYRSSIAELDKALAWAKRAGRLRHEILCYLFRGETRLRAGDLDTAEIDLREAIDLATQSGRETMLLEARLRLAEVRIAQNRLPEAAELLDLVEPQPPYEDDSIVAAEFLLASAKLDNARSRYADAVDRGERASALFRSIPDLVIQVRALDTLAIAYQGLGQAETAETRRNEAQRMRDRLGIVSEPEIVG